MGKLKKPPVDVRHECEYNEEIVAKLKDAGWTEKGLAGYGAINHESDVAVITDFKLFEDQVDYSFDDYRDFFRLTKANYKEWKNINLAQYNAIYGVNPNKVIEPLRILHGGYKANIMAEVVLGFTSQQKPIIMFMPYKDDYAVFIVAPRVGSDGGLEFDPVTIDDTHSFVVPPKPRYYDLKTQTMGYYYNGKIIPEDKLEEEWNTKHREFLKHDNRKEGKAIEESREKEPFEIYTTTKNKEESYALMDTLHDDGFVYDIGYARIRDAAARITELGNMNVEVRVIKQLKERPRGVDMYLIWRKDDLFAGVGEEKEVELTTKKSYDTIYGDKRLWRHFHDKKTNERVGFYSIEIEPTEKISFDVRGFKIDEVLGGTERDIEKLGWENIKANIGKYFEPHTEYVFKFLERDYNEMKEHRSEIKKEEPAKVPKTHKRTIIDTMKFMEERLGCDLPLETLVSNLKYGVETTAAGDIDRAIYELKRDGILFVPQEGVIRRTDCEEKETSVELEPLARENVSRGYKQFVPGINTAQDIVKQYPTEDIRVFGSVQRFKRAPLKEREARGLIAGAKTIPDLDIVVHTAEVEEFIKARENQIDFTTHDIKQYIKETMPGGYSGVINIDGDTFFRAGERFYKWTTVGLQWMDNPDLVKSLKQATPINEVIESFYKLAVTGKDTKIKHNTKIPLELESLAEEAQNILSIKKPLTVQWKNKEGRVSVDWFKSGKDLEKFIKLNPENMLLRINRTETFGMGARVEESLLDKAENPITFQEFYTSTTKKAKTLKHKENHFQRKKRWSMEAVSRMLPQKLKRISELEMVDENWARTEEAILQGEMEEHYKEFPELKDEFEEKEKPPPTTREAEKLKQDIITEVLSETRIKKVHEPYTAIRVMWDNIDKVDNQRELIRIGDARWNIATSKYVRANYDKLVDLTKEAMKRYNERRKDTYKREQVWIEGYLKERWRCPICGRAAPGDFCVVHSDVDAVDILADKRVREMVLEVAPQHGKRGLKEHVLEYLEIKHAKPFVSEEWLAKQEKLGKTFYHIKPQIDALIADYFETEERVKEAEKAKKEEVTEREKGVSKKPIKEDLPQTILTTIKHLEQDYGLDVPTTELVDYVARETGADESEIRKTIGRMYGDDILDAPQGLGVSVRIAGKMQKEEQKIKHIQEKRRKEKREKVVDVKVVKPKSAAEEKMHWLHKRAKKRKAQTKQRNSCRWRDTAKTA